MKAKILFSLGLVLGLSCVSLNALADVTFEVAQSASIFIGHEPYVVILDHHGLILDVNAQSSSAFWGYPGMMSINIRKG
jgi:hypothetical protein